MRFMESVVVILSPILCLTAVFAIDDAKLRDLQAQQTRAATVQREPVPLAALGPPVRSLRPLQAALKLTPVQTRQWRALEPSTLSRLQSASGSIIPLCEDAALAQRWAHLTTSFSPRQSRVYQAREPKRLAGLIQRKSACDQARIKTPPVQRTAG